jgi:hypothetical protein
MSNQKPLRMITLSSLTRVSGAAAIVLAVVSCASLTFVFAHEGHEMECSESNINAMKADVQAMPDGNSKTTAIKEMQAAQRMRQMNDMNSCMAHMHDAMKVIEK